MIDNKLTMLYKCRIRIKQILPLSSSSGPSLISAISLRRATSLLNDKSLIAVVAVSSASRRVATTAF